MHTFLPSEKMERAIVVLALSKAEQGGVSPEDIWRFLAESFPELHADGQRKRRRTPRHASAFGRVVGNGWLTAPEGSAERRFLASQKARLWWEQTVREKVADAMLMHPALHGSSDAERYREALRAITRATDLKTAQSVATEALAL